MKGPLLTRGKLTALIVTALAIAIVVTLAFRRSGDTATAAEPTAAVVTAVAAEGSLSGTAVAYGTVTSAPRHTISIAVLHDATVKSVAVRDGEAVRAGTALVTVTRAPATSVQYAQASSALEFARQDFARVQRLFADKLATNDQFAAAAKARSDAQAQVDQQHRIGADQAEEILHAPFDGVVGGLSVTSGDRLQANATIATLASRSDLIVQLGIEPSDARKLAPGAPVRLSVPLDGSAVIAGRLASVGAMVDPTTRFVKAAAEIPVADASHVSLGMTLIGRIDLPAQQGVVMPRGALLEDAAGTYVYVVANKKAHRQPVQILVETEDRVLVAKGLAAGRRVIVSGNAALEEGVAVQEAKP